LKNELRYQPKKTGERGGAPTQPMGMGMQLPDWIVLCLYFAGILGLGATIALGALLGV